MTGKMIPLHELAVGTVGVEVFAVSQPEVLQHLREAAAAPHRHDHYSCFFVEQGSIEMTVDFQPVHLSAASLLVSQPGQIHQLGAAAAFQGWLLVADAKLIGQNARCQIEQSLTGIALLHLDAAEQTWFHHLFSALHVACAAHHPPLLRTEILQSLLNAVICQAAALLEVQEHQQAQAHTPRRIVLTKQFRQLLQQHFLTCKKPADYAGKLHVTVSYLNDTVKAVTGFSVSYFIRQEVLAEAQRLLFYTNLSVKEVAIHLGYDDPKYFIRYFGKGTGVSPTRFRKNTGLYTEPS
jgi:AraC-like DNA-binding protein